MGKTNSPQCLKVAVKNVTIKKVTPFLSNGHVAFELSKTIVVYGRPDEKKDAIPVETNVINVNISDIRDNIASLGLAYLAAVNFNRVDRLVLAALTNAKVTVCVNPFKKGDEYTITYGDEKGTVKKHDHAGANVSLKDARLDPNILSLAITAIIQASK